MIFTFSDQSFQKINFELINTDIFCFFHSENAVKVPAEFWFQAVVSSLKLKKNVLILDGKIPVLPLIESQRWVIGEDFLWLAPRSSSVLFEAISSTSGSYQAVKSFLTHFKQLKLGQILIIS